MSRLTKIIILSLLMIACTPALQAQQDSGKAQSYEEYEQQGGEEKTQQHTVNTEEETTAADSSITNTDEETYTDEETETKAYTPLFVKPEVPPQQKDRNVTAAQWRQLTSDPSFNYEEEPQQPQKTEESWWSRFFEKLFLFLASGVGKILLIIIVGVLVIYLVVRIFQLKGNVFFSRKDKKLAGGTDDETSDEYIPDNWEAAIKEAATAGNYRLAVRHSYRYLLHLLGEKELITIQTAKTNYQYAFELSGTPLHTPFMQLTRNYEYAWYGGFDIARDRFEAYYDQVSGIKKELH